MYLIHMKSAKSAKNAKSAKTRNTKRSNIPSAKGNTSGYTSGYYSTVHNPQSSDELECLLAKTQRRRAATQIAAAARRCVAQKKVAWARVARIIKKAEAKYAAAKHTSSKSRRMNR